MSHWYPRYPADYGKKTRHLSLMEHGAYVLMMDHCYSTGKPIPANAEQLHRICSAFDKAEQEACSRVLKEFFKLGPDGWSNPRIDEELQKRNDISDKRSKAGKIGAEKRAASVPANATANDQANANTSTATSTSTEIKEDSRAKALLSSDDDDFSEIEIAFDAYNESATRAGWPKAQALTKTRKAALKARLKEAGGLDGWRVALGKAEASPHLCGQNDRGWTADLDFILQAKSFTKLMEGSYDRKQAFNGNATGRPYTGGNGQPRGLVGAAMRAIANGTSGDEARGGASERNADPGDLRPPPSYQD